MKEKSKIKRAEREKGERDKTRERSS